jgi:acetyltransferase-like isoleucine patch superfamily enzyme
MAHYNAAYLRRPELEELGVTCGGDDVAIHSTAVIINPDRLRMENHVRVDAFCLLSATGGLSLGNYVHLGPYVSIAAGAGVVLEDFCGISYGSRIFTVTEDLSGRFMTNPTIPERFRRTKSGPVHMEKHSGLMAGVLVLPGVTLHEGAVAAAGSLVRKDIPAWEMWFGVPAKRIGPRRKDLLGLGDELMASSRQTDLADRVGNG